MAVLVLASLQTLNASCDASVCTPADFYGGGGGSPTNSSTRTMRIFFETMHCMCFYGVFVWRLLSPGYKSPLYNGSWNLLDSTSSGSWGTMGGAVPPCAPTHGTAVCTDGGRRLGLGEDDALLL